MTKEHLRVYLPALLAAGGGAAAGGAAAMLFPEGLPKLDAAVALAGGAAAGSAVWILRAGVAAHARRLAEWMRGVRLVDDRQPAPLDGPLAELGREAGRLGAALAEARASAEREARLRVSAESVWTAERLKEFVRQKLGDRRLYAVSNREPYRHARRNGRVVCEVPPSGLVTALEPVLRASEGLWLAQADTDEDMAAADERGRLRVPPEAPAYTLKRIRLSEELNQRFYEGFANEGLWPLCHRAHVRPIFRSEDWDGYHEANRRFADALLEEIGERPAPLVLIQDYHFALLPRMIRQAKLDARIALFWHIPWPTVEMFEICPWKEEIIDGLLGADILGFHTRASCRSFLSACDRYLQCRALHDRGEVIRSGHASRISPYPIGIGFTDTLEAKGGPSAAELKRAILAEHGVEAEFLGVGVDRLDYTKGILERLWAIDRFLRDYPAFAGRFTFVELGAPTRAQIERYADFAKELDACVAAINARHARGNWKPVIFYKDQHDAARIRRYYRAADLCLVTSLHDGMNLVAMEYAAAKADLDGVLILSRFTGAAEELTDALLVNPYDIGEVSRALREALEMPAEARRRRMERMRERIKERNVFRWAGELVDDLCRIHPEVTVA